MFKSLDAVLRALRSPAAVLLVVLSTVAIPLSSSAPATSQSMTPLYRWFYSPANHLYITDPNPPGPGWTYNGICCYVYGHGNQVEGTDPFHRWYRPQVGNHFYSLDPNEPQGPGFVYEGHCCYIYPNPTPGTVPLHRFHKWISNASRWIWTTDITCCSTWDYEGVAGYVVPN